MKIPHLPLEIIFCVHLFVCHIESGQYSKSTASNSDLDKAGFSTDIEDLSFRAGDRIRCSKDGWFSHRLLAISNNELIHVIGDEDTMAGRVHRSSIPHYLTFASGTGRRCQNKGPGSRDIETAVALAISAWKKFGDHNKHVFYSLYTCNCEHWVRYWADGEAFSWQSFRGADSACQAIAGYGCSTNGRCWSDCGSADEWCLVKNWNGDWPTCQSRDDCNPDWECGTSCSVHPKSIDD